MRWQIICWPGEGHGRERREGLAWVRHNPPEGHLTPFLLVAVPGAGRGRPLNRPTAGARP